jgi:neurotransmitter:Na+ symporter, NSS family
MGYLTMQKEVAMANREFWDNRMGFILAAIGSAIGLGNVWRFPYICYKYGGGAFLIPYLVALFTAGIPIMILEFGIGHKMASAAPTAIGKCKKSWEWLGWFALLVAFMITCYYAVIMGWCVNFLKLSFTLGWGDDPNTFFMKDFLNVSNSHFELGGLKSSILIGLIISWVAIIASLWRGAKTVGKVVYITVVLPWCLLILFLLRGLTLPGAFTGLAYYLKPDFSALANLEVWAAAYTQIFFSLSVGFGIMMAYASFLPKKSDIVNNAFIISLADAGTAFVGGLVVFSTLGYYAHQTGQPVEAVVKAGPSLAFITYPTIINLFPILPKLFGVLFFLMLLTLGIDSAFSLVEGVAAGLMDKYNAKRLPVLITIALISIIIGSVYCTNAGLLWLDIVDHFMNQYGLMSVVLLEAIFVGWIIKPDLIRNHVNTYSEFKIGKWWDFLIKFVVPISLTILILSWLGGIIESSYEGYPRLAEFIGGWLLVLLIPLAAVLLSGALRAGLFIAVVEIVMIVFSLFAGHQGLNFSGIMMFNIAFLILFGGVAVCIFISQQNPLPYEPVE